MASDEIERLRAQLAKAEARIAELEARADSDPLLDVRNRRGLAHELARSIAFIRRYRADAALIYLDLDGFKAINDRHGHAAGDAVLRAVAAKLAQQVRASDLVARLGGDEFGILMWNAGAAQAAAKALALEAAIAALAVEHNGHRLTVTASTGVAPLTAEDTPETVIDAADRAMYARKKTLRRGSA